MKKEKRTTTAGNNPLAVLLGRVTESVYRWNYFLGMRVLRLVYRACRWLGVKVAPLRKTMAVLWRQQVLRRVQRMKRAWQYFKQGLPVAKAELKAASKRGVRGFFSGLWDVTGRAAWRHRRHARKLWIVAAPAASLLVLLITVAAWTGTDFCLQLNYRGQNIGFIDSATVYNQAAGMATDRVVNVDNSFSVDAAPRLSIAIKGRNKVMDDTQVCDAILRTAGDSIAEATGLYVDDKFIASMESEAELLEVFDSLKAGYYDKNNPNERAEFVQDVKTMTGLFPAASVVDKQTIADKLTSEAVVKKTYVVKGGDTLSQIAVRHNMTTSQLRKMNPAYAKTDMVRVGDELIVQLPEPLLQVKVIKTIRYSEAISYNTVYKNNNNKPITYSVVKTKGQEGSQDIVAEVTFIDGEKSGTKIISKKVTKQPVTRVIERGTKRASTQSGSAAVQGDGVAKGKMSWPVPCCSNMSRGWQAGHYALDIANGPVTVRNKPCIAADGGTVVYAGWYGAYGYYVRIRHSNGLETAYAHLNAIRVVKGQRVSRNQTVGLIGSTGQSTGPHLHFEVIRNGVRVNPLNYVTRGKIYY